MHNPVSGKDAKIRHKAREKAKAREARVEAPCAMNQVKSRDVECRK